MEVVYTSNEVAYSFNGGGVYVQWGWRIVPMEVAYKSNGAKMAYTFNGPKPQRVGLIIGVIAG